MTKHEYIGRYIEREMKNNKLLYGMEYLNLLAESQEKAEKLWERKIKKS